MLDTNTPTRLLGFLRLLCIHVYCLVISGLHNPMCGSTTVNGFERVGPAPPELVTHLIREAQVSTGMRHDGYVSLDCFPVGK